LLETAGRRTAFALTLGRRVVHRGNLGAYRLQTLRVDDDRATPVNLVERP
jgi:hypothetical protein